MNEEELKKEINVGISYTNPNRVWKAIGDLEDLGFQKGKLEVLNKLNETYPDLKTQEDRKIFVKWKEQLQKEIGGMK